MLILYPTTGEPSMWKSLEYIEMAKDIKDDTVRNEKTVEKWKETKLLPWEIQPGRIRFIF